MQIRYYKEYSRYLNRDMEFKVYGHAGRPILIFPCQSGRFFDWDVRVDPFCFLITVPSNT